MKYIKNDVAGFTEYDKAETAFIESLPQEKQIHIRRGLVTPYDYGYKDKN